MLLCLVSNFVFDYFIGDSIDEGIGKSGPANDTSLEDMRREILELRLNLDHERSIRIHLEEQIQKLESQRAVPDTTYDIALRDHLSYHSSPEVCFLLFLFFSKVYLLYRNFVIYSITERDLSVSIDFI